MLAKDCSEAGISAGDFLLFVIIYIRIDAAAGRPIKNHHCRSQGLAQPIIHVL
jgi:hypothetical protein